MLSPMNALAGAPAPTSPRERSQILLVEGDAALERGEPEEALSKYRSAYYGLSRSDQASYLGSLLVRKAMQAYEQSVVRERDPKARRALLERQRGFLDELLDAVAARQGAAEEIGPDVMAELETIRRGLDEALDGEPLPPDGPTDEGEQDREPASAPTRVPPKLEPVAVHDDRRLLDVEAPARDEVGLGLAIAGSTVLAAGLGLMVPRWTIPPSARKQADDHGKAYAEGTQRRADYLEDQDALAYRFLVAGSVVASVGLATAIAGAVHLGVHRRRHARRSAALQVAPLLDPTTTGIALHRWF